MIYSDFNNKLNEKVKHFSNHLMNNSKWYKLFKFLSSITDDIDSIEIVAIWEDTRNNQLKRSVLTDFEFSFSDTGINDVLLGGPLSFKEIKEIIIKLKNDNIIVEGINRLGEFDFELEQDFIAIYGYK